MNAARDAAWPQVAWEVSAALHLHGVRKEDERLAERRPGCKGLTKAAPFPPGNAKNVLQEIMNSSLSIEFKIEPVIIIAKISLKAIAIKIKTEKYFQIENILIKNKLRIWFNLNISRNFANKISQNQADARGRK